MEFGISRCKCFLYVELAISLVDAMAEVEGGGGFSSGIMVSGQFRDDSL